ncbi:uncharacterized protein LOC126795736 [Argentina anserina]|uniref:uncharacterized protein LOC126795736 n=1 Tax=Argentina anserina TaxID=57926 RepID=UPI0021764340|nr:uncharacterized protein LOC126795736 [Potentilla anserina]
MDTEGSSVPMAIPRFDGYYNHWAMTMDNFIRSKECWDVIEPGIPAMPQGAEISQPRSFSSVVAERTQQIEGQQKQSEERRQQMEEQCKFVEKMKLKDLKVKNFLFLAIDRKIMETILVKDTSKQIWDSMKLKYQGTSKVHRAQRHALRKEFEILQMKVGESVDEYFARTLIIEKILRSMTPKFDYVVCSVEESKDLDTLTIDELQSSLLVHEQRMKGHEKEEQVIKVSLEDRLGGRGRGRGAFRGRGRSGGRQSFNKATVECFKCHKLGHFQYECPSWEKRVNYAELDEDEELLLMSYVEMNNYNREGVWFLDSGCSNHMSGNKQWFTNLDEESSVTI